MVATLGSHDVDIAHDWEALSYAVLAAVRGRILRLEISFSGAGAADIDELRFVPEPSSAALLAFAILLMAARRRRQAM